MSESKEEPPASLSPKKIVQHAKRLLREGERLLAKKKKHLDAGAQQEVQGALDAVFALVPSRKNPVSLAPKRLDQAAIALDGTLSRHLGRWRKGQVREFFEAIFWALIIALVIRSFFLEAFSIPSSSMYPTLRIGDHLFVNKVEMGLYIPFSPKRAISWHQPTYGDIIVFRFAPALYPNDPLFGEDFIKRVVALPGDRVRLEDDRIILNGKAITTRVVEETQCGLFGADWNKEPVTTCPCIIQEEQVGDNTWRTQHLLPGCGRREAWSGDWPQEVSLCGPHGSPHCKYFGDQATNPNWPDVVVPEGHVFVMGDNRDASEDGRFWGFVPFQDIKGKAFVLFYPFDRMFKWLG